MKESNTLISMEGGPVRNLEDSQVKIQYLIYKSLIHGGTKYAEMLYRKLTASQDARQAEVLLVTARVYYQENGSVQKASERLHLHKNTLLYLSLIHISPVASYTYLMVRVLPGDRYGSRSSLS